MENKSNYNRNFYKFRPKAEGSADAFGAKVAKIYPTKPAGSQKAQQPAQGKDAAKKSSEGQGQKKAPAKSSKPKTTKKTSSAAEPKSKLKVIPIGGLHEIGKNMTVLEYENDIIIIDCGMAFPDEQMLGIDVVIPDFTYLTENANKIRGVFITHGHEDHIGAVPYFVQKFNVPIYGSKLTLGFIKHKLEERRLDAKLVEIKPKDTIKIGCYKVEALHTTHSVADSLAYCIETPVGRVFHTGDFKVDYTPVDGETIDFGRFAELGRAGIQLLLADSTNAARKGFTPSEKTIGVSLGNIFPNIKGRIIIATFSSNVHRVQKIIDAAVANKRKVAVSGRSMENMVTMARDMEYLHIPAGTLVDLKDVKDYADSKLVIITTGSQGEPMSALTRMANGEHRDVKIKKGDTIILSSTPVPGNEKSVSNTINSLLANGASVIYNDIAETHVSGHACEEELKLIHSLLKPKFFMPLHGEVKHLSAHAAIAEGLGMKPANIFLGENGSVLEVGTKKAMLLPEKVQANAVLVDGLGVGDVGTAVINERRNLSEAGIVIIVVTRDAVTGEILDGPEVHTRGFVYVKEYGEIIDEAEIMLEQELAFALEDGIDQTQALKDLMKSRMKNWVFKKTNRNPIIVPIIMEV